MDILNYINTIKPQLLKEIEIQCKEIQEEGIAYSHEIGNKLFEYTSRGKLLRGIFICLSAESFGMTLNKEILATAGALEIAQSAILIHDDVMDKDDIRRGKSSIHKMYQEEGFSTHEANSLAICIGDVGLFHAFRYLNKEVSQLFSKELTKTAIGQTYDVMKAALNEEITQEDIMLIIQNKTANYTFALPFLSGYLLSGKQDLKTQEIIKELSCVLGFIFQVRDDELNYLSESQTGKSVGGDIRENKKTLCRALLIEEFAELKNLYGQEEYIEQIRECYDRSKTKQKIGKMIDESITIAKGFINQLPIQKEYINYWYTLLEYLYFRRF